MTPPYDGGSRSAYLRLLFCLMFVTARRIASNARPSIGFLAKRAQRLLLTPWPDRNGRADRWKGLAITRGEGISAHPEEWNGYCLSMSQGESFPPGAHSPVWGR